MWSIITFNHALTHMHAWFVADSSVSFGVSTAVGYSLHAVDMSSPPALGYCKFCHLVAAFHHCQLWTDTRWTVCDHHIYWFLQDYFKEYKIWMLLYQAVHMCLLGWGKHVRMLPYVIQLDEIIATELKHLCFETIRTSSLGTPVWQWGCACVTVKCKTQGDYRS